MQYSTRYPSNLPTPPISPDLLPNKGAPVPPIAPLSKRTQNHNASPISRPNPLWSLKMESVIIPSETVPEALKSCEQILKRAKELKKAEPVVAYWCKLIHLDEIVQRLTPYSFRLLLRSSNCAQNPEQNERIHHVPHVTPRRS